MLYCIVRLWSAAWVRWHCALAVSGLQEEQEVELLQQSWIPQVRLTWTIFSVGLADITSVEEVLLGFVGSWMPPIFYQVGERVSRCSSADSVFLKFLVGPKFSIDEGCLTTKLRVFLSISAEAACWMTQIMFCGFCCRGGNPFEQKKDCFIRLWCWFVSPLHEHWLQIEWRTWSVKHRGIKVMYF